MPSFDGRTKIQARLCLRGQPQQLRQEKPAEPNATPLLRDTLRLVLQTQPRSVPFSFGGSGKMRPRRRRIAAKWSKY